MKRGIGMLAAAVVGAGVLSIPAVASAQPVTTATHQTTQSGAIDEAGLRKRFDAAGVPPATQDSLIQKLRDGQTWDSQNGSAPVSTKTATANDVRTTTLTYADGSLVINTAQVPQLAPATDSGMQPMSVDSCTYGSGVGTFPFWGCHIATNQLSFSIDFYIDGHTSNIGGANITNYHDIGYWTAAASVNKTRFTAKNLTQNGSTPASVQATLDVTFIGGSGSGVYQLTAHVADAITDTSP